MIFMLKFIEISVVILIKSYLLAKVISFRISLIQFFYLFKINLNKKFGMQILKRQNIFINSSIDPSIHPSINPSIHPPIHPFTFIFTFLFIFLFIFIFIFIFIFLFIFIFILTLKLCGMFLLTILCCNNLFILLVSCCDNFPCCNTLL